MKPLAELLEASAALHTHLCPRQVLGVRMGMLAGEILSLDLPQADKRLLVIAETDGCFVDGVGVATNCWVGRRTLRIEDYGKVAATFVDTRAGQAFRLVPRAGVRRASASYAPEARSPWHTQLLGYQRMPAGELFAAQDVQLRFPAESILSRAGRKVECQACGEEIINDRHVFHEGTVLCRTCLGQGYYTLLVYPLEVAPVESSPLAQERR